VDFAEKNMFLLILQIVQLMRNFTYSGFVKEGFIFPFNEKGKNGMLVRMEL
jgi:hypothetical protein